MEGRGSIKEDVVDRVVVKEKNWREVSWKLCLEKVPVKLKKNSFQHYGKASSALLNQNNTQLVLVKNGSGRNKNGVVDLCGGK